MAHRRLVLLAFQTSDTFATVSGTVVDTPFGAVTVTVMLPSAFPAKVAVVEDVEVMLAMEVSLDDQVSDTSVIKRFC